MILWKDFVLDDVFGPLLNDEATRTREIQVSCRKRLGSRDTQEEASGNIQETRQEQRPARMAGLSGLDSQKAGFDMEVDGDRADSLRRRGEA